MTRFGPIWTKQYVKMINKLSDARDRAIEVGLFCKDDWINGDIDDAQDTEAAINGIENYIKEKNCDDKLLLRLLAEFEEEARICGSMDEAK